MDTMGSTKPERETRMPAPPKLGDLLIDQGLINHDQLDFSLREQKATGERMGECLMRLGLLMDSDLAEVLARQVDYPFIDLRNFLPDRSLLALIPAKIATHFQFLVIQRTENILHIAISDPFSKSAEEQAYRITGLIIKAHVAGEHQLKRMIERFYYLIENPIEDEIKSITDRLVRNPNVDVDVQRLVDNLMGSAISYRVTDIHITPSDISSRVMYRVDGVLKPVYVFPFSLHSRLITTIKVNAGMDIAEQRKPQDGRMSFDFFGETFDVRVSSVRTNFGENIVLRLLPSRGSSSFNVRDLGFEEEKQKTLKSIFSMPYGMVLVTGPTGSGKTTTLYAALREQDAIGKNILTVEDPIEYELLMIRQTQVNTKAGYTFASAIRTFLRQDPDVMLIGEIRDEETAVLAVRAALTGHLVLSTLHSNSAIAALARLKDLGLSPYLLSTSLKGILSQRLVRRLCNFCKKPAEIPGDVLAKYGLEPDGHYFSAGRCNHCQETGYIGRDAISEVIPISDNLMRLIADDAPLGALEDAARSEGVTDLRSSGINKVRAGVTSLEELVRVIG